MKPWEETWQADDWNVETDEQKQLFTCPRPYWDDTPAAELKARAKLAAQAPAMARLLLDLQWVRGETDEGATPAACPTCFESARWNWRTKLNDGKHKPDCELMKVLRDAGVIE